jgi:hypothetical protein
LLVLLYRTHHAGIRDAGILVKLLVATPLLTKWKSRQVKGLKLCAQIATSVKKGGEIVQSFGKKMAQRHCVGQ